MATNGKDIIYIDIDDEITTIIEKVRASGEKIVALVLPKRATVLQSIVNMKLLKRSADDEKKNLVLITSEVGLLPLAGTVGLYVAKTLQTKPEIPIVAGAEDPDEIEDVSDELSASNEEVTKDTAGNKSIGELAGQTAVAAAATDEVETLQLDDEDSPVPTDSVDDKDSKSGTKSKRPKKDKKLAVPNFNRFRLMLILGVVLLLVLIVGGVFAMKVLPKATVIIKTDTSSIDSSLTFTADTGVKQVNADPASLTVPAQTKQVAKTQTQQVPTTGQKNNGVKAAGKVTLSLPDCSISQVTVPAGTGVSSGGLTFITQADVTLQSVKVGSQCKNSAFPDFSTATVNVTALAGGSNYNIAPATFKVAGFSGIAASSSSAMSGGTDDVIQIVAQADVDSATQKIAAIDTSTVKQQLDSQLKSAGLFPLDATFVAGTPTTSTSSNVGDQATTITVTQAITYTMYGVKQSDLKTLVDNDVKGKIDPAKQSILSEGLDKATFKVNNTGSSSVQIAMSTTSTAGPDLKAAAIKTQIAGKKAGEVKDMLKNDPGVTDVSVNLSPFWVTSVPTKADKVTITFQKAN